MKFIKYNPACSEYAKSSAMLHKKWLLHLDFWKPEEKATEETARNISLKHLKR